MPFSVRIGLVPLVLVVLTAPQPAFSAPQRSAAAAIGRDPRRDAAFPAITANVQIPVNGSRINAFMMVASGAPAHPTMLLLHGFAGYEGLLDVGEAARRAGINVLAIHYRGAWGSEGTFTFGGSVDDAEAAIGWLTDPKTAARYRIDTSRIYAVGHSFGGFVAMMLAARTRDVRGIAYISGWDIGSDASPWVGNPPKGVVDEFDEDARMYGTTSGTALVKEVVDHAREYTLATIAPRVADRPILMTYAQFEEEDNSPRRNFEPLRAALERAGATHVQTQMFATDHSYSDKRVALSRALVDWLFRIAGERR